MDVICNPTIFNMPIMKLCDHSCMERNKQEKKQQFLCDRELKLSGLACKLQFVMKTEMV